MNTAADILALCIMATATGFVCLVLAGVARMFGATRRARIDGERLTLRGNPYAETGISVVVAGPQSPYQVERRLSENYVHYEVILATDFETDPFGRELLKKYSLIKTDRTPTANPGSADIRGVYRSRQRRYRRLVVVDCRADSVSQGFNCGMDAASYEHAVCLDGHTFLYGDALAVLNDEYLRGGPGLVPCAVRLYGTGGTPYGRIDTAVKTAMFGAGFGTAGMRGARIAEAALLPRERAMEAGGFRGDFRPEAELLRRMKVCAAADCRKLRIRHIPLALAEEEFTAAGPAVRCDGCADSSPARISGSGNSFGSRPSGRDTRSIKGNIPAWAVGLFWSAVLVLTVWAAATDTQDVLKKCLLIFLTGYLATVAAASAALTGFGKMFLRPDAGGPLSPYLILNALGYPFYRLRRTLSAKNFSGS